MGFLTNLLTPELLASAALVNAGLAVLAWFLPNSAVKKAGYGLGVVLSKVFRQRLGKNGEKVEGRFQATLSEFIAGINEGCDADDNEG